MVAQFMLRVYSRNLAFFEKNFKFVQCCRSKRMHFTGRISWFTPCTRITIWATMYYKYHATTYFFLGDNCSTGIYLSFKRKKSTLFFLQEKNLNFYAVGGVHVSLRKWLVETFSNDTHTLKGGGALLCVCGGGGLNVIFFTLDAKVGYFQKVYSSHGEINGH